MSTDEDLSEFESAKAGAREECKRMSLLELVREMHSMAAEKAKIEAELSMINARYDVLRYEAIPTKMDDDGIERLTVEGVGRVSLTGDMFVATVDKAGLYKWLEDNGFDDIIQPSVNASTLKAFIKERTKSGKEVPTDFVRITPVTRASITKAR